MALGPSKVPSDADLDSSIEQSQDLFSDGDDDLSGLSGPSSPPPCSQHQVVDGYQSTDSA